MVKNRAEALQALNTHIIRLGENESWFKWGAGIGFDQYKTHLNNNMIVIAQIDILMR